MKNKYIIAFLSLAVLFACEPKIDEFPSSAGTADFSKYIAIGNSLTAGFASQALSQEGQMYSFPNMLATKLKEVGMQGELKQPLIPLINEDDKGIGIGSDAQGNPVFHTKLKLGLVPDGSGGQTLSPVPYDVTVSSAELGAALLTSVAGDGPYNNLGVPGAKAGHLLFDKYGTYGAMHPVSGDPLFNPYYVRFASTPSTTILEEAMAQAPSFFTLWIGNNDVLGYATSGGAVDVLTDLTEFTTYMTAIINTLVSNGAKGAVANIPDVTSIPFFTTVPYNALLLDEATATALNTAYAALGITFSAGNNPFIIVDLAAPGEVRQMQEGELVLLSIPQADIKNPDIGLGSKTPIPSQYVLTAAEIQAIQTATAQFNDVISVLVNNKDIALVDMNTHLNTLKTGLLYDGISMNTTFITGGAFSLDGIHLNPRGNAVIANFFIDAINAKFNARVPKVNVTDYPGIKFP